MIRAIVAIDEQRGIARNGQIPWNIPDDQHYYVEVTAGAPVIMGRATYESLSGPLPERRNIVIGNSLETVRPGFELVNDLKTLLSTAKEDVWIIGGSGIYEAALPYCSELYITHLLGNYDCDRFFPRFDDFALRDERPWQRQNDYDFRYAIYEKR